MNLLVEDENCEIEVGQVQECSLCVQSVILVPIIGEYVDSKTHSIGWTSLAHHRAYAVDCCGRLQVSRSRCSERRRNAKYAGESQLATRGTAHGSEERQIY